jgi:hypothetical protein
MNNKDKSKEIEINISNKVLFLSFYPIQGKNYINIYGHDITEIKNAEIALTAAIMENEATRSLEAGYTGRAIKGCCEVFEEES